MPSDAGQSEDLTPAGRGVRKVTAYLTRQGGAGTQLLVFRDPGHPRFGLVVPGGTVDDGERLEDALRREVYEESGLTSVRMLRHGTERTAADGVCRAVVGVR